MRGVVFAGLAALLLAGCQTAQESFVDADITCRDLGYRPGTRAFTDCRAQNYQQNRANSQATANAVAAGVVAGVVGGAVVASAARPSYYRGWGRCNAWGCW